MKRQTLLMRILYDMGLDECLSYALISFRITCPLFNKAIVFFRSFLAYVVVFTSP